MNFRLRTNDADQLVEQLSPIFGQRVALSSARGNQFCAEFDIRISEDLHVGRAEYLHGLTSTLHGLSERLCLSLAITGNHNYKIGNTSLEMTTGTGSIFNGSQCSKFLLSENSQLILLSMKVTTVKEILENVTGQTVKGDIEFNTDFKMDSHFGRCIISIISLLTAEADDDSIFVRSPHATKLIKNATIMALVEKLPHSHSFLLEPRTAEPGSWQIRRAIEFIDAQLFGPLTVQDVASAIGISIRSLQEGFKRHKNMSPNQYIKLARLAGVRRALLDLSSNLTITKVAHHWGFINMSHLAREYRQIYGEFPSHTRRPR